MNEIATPQEMNFKKRDVSRNHTTPGATNHLWPLIDNTAETQAIYC